MNAAAYDAGTLKDAAEQSKDASTGKIIRIGDLAEQFGITLRALRFYEDKGLINPKRNGTTRLYSYRDRARLKLILLGRKVGFSLREVKQILDLYNPSEANATQLKVTLEKTRKQQDKLVAQRKAIDEAIAELGQLTATVADMLEGKRQAS